GSNSRFSNRAGLPQNGGKDRSDEIKEEDSIAETTKSNHDRVREIAEGIEGKIQNLFASDQYAAYLKTAAKFHRYSLNNTILIFAQRPEATRVASYKVWQQLGRQVNKGEKGIEIIAPSSFKRTVREKRIDPATRQEMTGADGKPVFTEREIQIPSYRTVKVFDIAQTEGAPLPEISHDLTGNVEHYEAFMEAIRRSSPVPIEIRPMDANTDGFFSQSEQVVEVRVGMGQAQTVCAAIHEISHSLLHNNAAPIPEDAPEYDEAEAFGVPALFVNGRVSASEIPCGLFRYDLRGSDDDPGQPAAVENHVGVNHAGTLITAKPLPVPKNGFLPLTDEDGLDFTGNAVTMPEFRRKYPKDRKTVETEAESCAFVVCAAFGVETDSSSLGYIASYNRDRTLPELRSSLETIIQTSNRLITDIERNFAAVCKERGIAQPKRWEETLETARKAAEADWETKKSASPRGKGGKTGKKRTSQAR
ncbi:MAG: DUF1738 domain-containing protein, partial [Abditibacteriota bacterium]|nr:DUF1738 domain-containing protein [Abditibacteriota bacterium]